jgi:hypothetical protein
VDPGLLESGPACLERLGAGREHQAHPEVVLQDAERRCRVNRFLTEYVIDRVQRDRAAM